MSDKQVNVTQISSDVRQYFTESSEQLKSSLHGKLVSEIQGIPTARLESAANALDKAYDTGFLYNTKSIGQRILTGQSKDVIREFEVKRDKYGQISEFVFETLNLDCNPSVQKVLTIPLLDSQKPIK